MKGKLQDASSENTKLLERIKSIEALLEAGQMREAEKDRDLQVLGVFNRGGRRIKLVLVPVLALISLWGATEVADLHPWPRTGNESDFCLPGSQRSRTEADAIKVGLRAA